MSHARSWLPRLGGTTLVLLSLLLLAGCFTSSQPKFPLSSAVPAFGDGGRYVGYQRQSDGSFRRDEVFDVRKRADGGYDFVDAKGEVTPLSLHALGPDIFVAQAVRKNSSETDYAVLRVRGTEVLSYTLDCSKQDAAKMKALGVDIRDEGRVCSIDRVADPAALLAGLALGEPTGKMVRE